MKDDYMTEHVALLGGTFDPIHIAHLRIAYELYETDFFDQFYFMPCYRPVHKGAKGKAPVQMRLAMLESALDDTPFVIENAEIDRKGPSYAVDTLEALKKAHPARRFYFVMGSDSLLYFHRWHRFERLLELTHLIVIDRPGFAIDAQSAVMPYLAGRQVDSLQQLKQHEAGRVYMSAVTMLAISSTDIRTRLQRGQSIRYLVPSVVENIIQKFDCYREKRR